MPKCLVTLCTSVRWLIVLSLTPAGKIEQKRAALVSFKNRAMQEEDAHLATLRKVFQELEATQMTADGLEAAAEEANSRHRDAAGTFGLLCQKTNNMFYKYAQNLSVMRLYALGIEKAAQGAAVRRGPPKHQPVQAVEYFLAQQQLLRLKDYIEKLDAVLQDLQEETKKPRRALIQQPSPVGTHSSFAGAVGTAVTATGFGRIPAVSQDSQSASECMDIVEFVRERRRKSLCSSATYKDSTSFSKATVGISQATGTPPVAAASTTSLRRLSAELGGRKTGKRVRLTSSPSRLEAHAYPRRTLKHKP